MSKIAQISTCVGLYVHFFIGGKNGPDPGRSSEELEVNQGIVQDNHWLSSQSERAKNTIHCFSIC